MLSFPSRTACCSGKERRLFAQSLTPRIARFRACEGYGPHPEELAKQASRRMVATLGLAAILRDARKGALLRMRSEIYSQPPSRAMTTGNVVAGRRPACGQFTPAASSQLRSVRGSEATPPGLSRENSRTLASGARTALRDRQPNPEQVRRQFPPGPMPVSRRQCFA